MESGSFTIIPQGDSTTMENVDLQVSYTNLNGFGDVLSITKCLTVRNVHINLQHATLSSEIGNVASIVTTTALPSLAEGGESPPASTVNDSSISVGENTTLQGKDLVASILTDTLASSTLKVVGTQCTTSVCHPVERRTVRVTGIFIIDVTLTDDQDDLVSPAGLSTHRHVLEASVANEYQPAAVGGIALLSQSATSSASKNTFVVDNATIYISFIVKHCASVKVSLVTRGFGPSAVFGVSMYTFSKSHHTDSRFAITNNANITLLRRKNVALEDSSALNMIFSAVHSENVLLTSTITDHGAVAILGIAIASISPQTKSSGTERNVLLTTNGLVLVVLCGGTVAIS